MASFPVRWWRAILALIQLKHDSANSGWVEPGNEITRAILSGRPLTLGAPKPSLAISASTLEAEPMAPVEQSAPAAAAEVALEVAEPAEKPARRRAGRAA